MNTDERKIFADQVSQLGSDIFQDPISELTRKRQNYLLITSVVAILLSLTVIKPVEGNFSILKVTISNPDVITLLAGGITAYFVVVYGISVFQDMAVYRYRLMRQRALLEELGLQALQAVVKVLEDEGYERAAKAVNDRYFAGIEQRGARSRDFQRNMQRWINNNVPFLMRMEKTLELVRKTQEQFRWNNLR
jgi:hypothetical protein